MEPTVMGSINVNLCGTCGNFYMTADAFEQIVGSKVNVKEHDHKHDGKGVICPACSKKMNIADMKGGRVDLCPNCGVVHSDRESMTTIAWDKINVDIDKKDDVRKAANGISGENHIMGFVLKMDEERNKRVLQAVETVEGMEIDAVFVLSKCGLLLKSYANNLREDMDEDIMGGMIVAITDFVSTSFSNFSEGESLQSIRFKGKEIAFEHGIYLILAMELSGTLNDDVRKKIASELNKIETTHKSNLEGWNGNLEEISDVISQFNTFVLPFKSYKSI
jgi:uncharacterized CHY-type Zn-finger protein